MIGQVKKTGLFERRLISVLGLRFLISFNCLTAILSWSRFIASWRGSTRQCPGLGTSQGARLRSPTGRPHQKRPHPKSRSGNPQYPGRFLDRDSSVSCTVRGQIQRKIGPGPMYGMQVGECFLNPHQVGFSKPAANIDVARDQRDPCATAANPPTRTNSTSAAIKRRTSSLRFCMSVFHGGTQGIGKI